MAIKAASRCEICHKDTIEEERGEVVGRKLNGVARIVCARARCRKEWKRIGAAIKVSWPESVVSGRSGRILVRDAQTGARLARVAMEEHAAPSPAPGKESEVKQPDLKMAPGVVESIETTVRKHTYPIELDEWAIAWVREHGAQRGTFKALALHIGKVHPEWVTRTDGVVVGAEAVAWHLVSVCKVAGLWPVKREPKAAEPVPEYRGEIAAALEPVAPVLGMLAPKTGDMEAKYLRRLARAAHDLVDRFVGDGKTAALEAVVEMMEEEAGRT